MSLLATLTLAAPAADPPTPIRDLVDGLLGSSPAASPAPSTSAPHPAPAQSTKSEPDTAATSARSSAPAQPAAPTAGPGTTLRQSAPAIQPAAEGQGAPAAGADEAVSVQREEEAPEAVPPARDVDAGRAGFGGWPLLSLLLAVVAAVAIPFVRRRARRAGFDRGFLEGAEAGQTPAEPHLRLVRKAE
ncbi:hypothetical protein ACQEUV_26835 [Micromonospora aurantiaca (nom. illeg.)]|uniref:hypothetical protein n=1 Tax=Micromonospora aurantiaca (nom. illeg.) TaxID=47850 RepID=UPI003DA4DEC7